MSPTKDDLTCEQNLYARHLYLLVHHARAAGSCPEAPGAGGAALSFKDMQICSRRPVLMPLRLHQIEFIIEPEAAVNLFAGITK